MAKIMQLSPAKFLATFAASEIFWRDQSEDGTVLTLIAARLVGGTPVIWGTIKFDSEPMTAFIESLDAGNEYAAFDDGSGGTQENEGILLALLSLV